MSTRRAASIAIALSMAACGSSARTASAPSTPGPAAGTPAAAPAPAAPPAKGWSNPGGMWMPQQLVDLADTVKALGLRVVPSVLADPTRDPLGAVLSIGGCTASFVSPGGLIATNHHCAQGALMYNSTPDENLLENGFFARTTKDEKWAGPTMHAYVAINYTDVTAQMTDGLAALPDDRARHLALEEREKGLLADCERGRPELRCRVDAYFGGGLWQLTEQLDLRDVRLVYAPPRGVGNFGGEIDNWMWPRHAGDFSLFRAYAAADGTPVEHSDGNVPYKPRHYLELAPRPLATGDLVLVAGYPGTTRRLATAGETEEAASFALPRSVEVNEQYLKVLDEVIKGHPDLRIKAEPTRRGLLNFMKKNGGVVKTLVDGGVLAQKKALDAKLAAWIDADPARKAKYAPALERIAALDAARDKTREADAAFEDLVGKPKLLAQAITIVRLAEERAKPDAKRKIEFQERNWSRLEHASRAMKKSYAREIDRAVLKLFLERALALPKAQRPPGLAKLPGVTAAGKVDDKALERLYATTHLEDTEARLKLLKTATPAQLRGSADPFIRLAVALLPDVKAEEAKDEAYTGGMAVAMPLYVQARREAQGGPVAPDANGTMRITFGHVVGPPKGGPAFTTLAELAAKATGEEPFDAPKAELDAIARGAGKGYASAEIGAVPVDFMSDTDITNGNSGSPTLNASGELVGLAFDGTLDTVASDWLYMKSVSRTIHVDLRYMLWYMDTIDGAGRLLDEMSVKRPQ